MSELVRVHKPKTGMNGGPGDNKGQGHNIHTRESRDVKSPLHCQSSGGTLSQPWHESHIVSGVTRLFSCSSHGDDGHNPPAPLAAAGEAEQA